MFKGHVICTHIVFNALIYAFDAERIWTSTYHYEYQYETPNVKDNRTVYVQVMIPAYFAVTEASNDKFHIQLSHYMVCPV